MIDSYTRETLQRAGQVQSLLPAATTLQAQTHGSRIYLWLTAALTALLAFTPSACAAQTLI